jgi:HEAT repeat protein
VNATLKSIQQLITHPDRELRLSAIRVLRAINIREMAIHKILANLMIETDDSEIFEAALATIEAAPHEQILRQLVRTLDRDEKYLERILDAIAKIGSKAVLPLKQQFEKVPPETQRRMVRVLPRIRTHLAHSFLIDCLAHPDLILMREAIRALREEIEKYNPAERNDLLSQLQLQLKDKRFRQNDSALSAGIIALGIIADPRSESKLLSFAAPGGTTHIRRYALMSLANLPLADSSHPEIVSALYPMLEDPDYDGLVRHAVTVLELINPDPDEQDHLRSLLKNRHTGVRIFAIGKLASLDSAPNAQLILDFLSASDQALKEAAVTALSQMPAAVNIILKAIDETPGQLRIQDVVSILSHHANRITAERARNRIKKLLAMDRHNDRFFDIHWEAMKNLRPDILRTEILKIVDEAFSAGQYRQAKEHLELLDIGGLLTVDLRYRLMLASLKVSSKSRSRSYRASDPALEHAVQLLLENPRDFKRRLVSEKILSDEDFLYLGYHFSERLNEERRFGADILRHVVTTWPRRQSAKTAKQKLQVEGQ